jgi:uncharacterized membrane protein (UPF0127 family)
MKLNLRIKDKIFIFIIGLGLLLLIINSFYSKKEEAGIIKEQTENKVSVKEERIAENLTEKEKATASRARVSIANKSLEVSVASTELERYQGLSDLEKLEENKGVLFLFDGYGSHHFIMRDMNFDLDFIFIRDGEVVDFKKNVKKDFPEEIFGSTKYNQVIEVGAGWIEKQGVLIGDEVEIVYF